jgi:hypothetical protein
MVAAAAAAGEKSVDEAVDDAAVGVTTTDFPVLGLMISRACFWRFGSKGAANADASCLRDESVKENIEKTLTVNA